MIDIDKFKHINDTYGHLAGDYVLKEFGSILKSNLNNNGIYCVRFGGDEFIILIDKDSLMNDAQILNIINKINLVLQNTLFSFDSNKINFGISFGYCLNKPGQYNSEELISCADKKLYIEKARKKALNDINASAQSQLKL